MLQFSLFFSQFQSISVFFFSLVISVAIYMKHGSKSTPFREVESEACDVFEIWRQVSKSKRSQVC